jgi:HTH-type transcriptional regulator/antitoxin HigA
MEKIELYLQKSTQQGGFHTLPAEERRELQLLSLAAEAWEDGVPFMPIRQPQSIIEMIELTMYERKLKQQELAALLDISPTRLSEVLKGKRKVNMDLAKRLYSVLHISPQFILEHA